MLDTLTQEDTLDALTLPSGELAMKEDPGHPK